MTGPGLGAISVGRGGPASPQSGRDFVHYNVDLLVAVRPGRSVGDTTKTAHLGGPFVSHYARQRLGQAQALCRGY